MTEDVPKKTFLGFDFSTQRLKAIVIGEDYAVRQEADVEFDVDLPEFRTSGGVVRGEGRGEVFAPPLLWVKALDMVMDRLVVAGVDFSTVEALSGAAQQHGSVWWAKGADAKLGGLSGDEFLHAQLGNAFLCDSPVWMDCSTSADCRALEEAVGGAEALAKLTGSRAYERFTGPQVRKMRRARPRLYAAAERLSLVSSFACSLFLGRVAPLDLADASGMNLLDIHRLEWCEQALMSCGDETLADKLGAPVPSGTALGPVSRYFVRRYGFKPDCQVVAFTGDNCSALAGMYQSCGDETLADKLGAPVPSATALGPVSRYFVRRYGFKPDCQVVAFTGDNCSALAGLRLRSGWVGLSLGTSDTLLLGLRAPAAPPAGHVLVGPTAQAPYMALLCFSNGSLTRQRHRDRLAGPSWEKFNELLRSTVRGNMGCLGIYYDTAEIVPRAAAGRWVRDAAGRATTRAAPQAEARALLEGQALARRAHAEDMGFKLDTAEIVPRAAAGRWVRDAAGRATARAAPQAEARALLEGQALARRAHAEDMGFKLDTAEIVPRAAAGRWVRDAAGRATARAAPQAEARALLEGQALARRAHAEDMGFTLDASSRLVATGGASVNRDLLQIFADVFNTPVYVQKEHANAALLGAAIRAADVWSAAAGVSLPGAEPSLSPVATPYPDAQQIYTPLLERYRELIKEIPKLD